MATVIVIGNSQADLNAAIEQAMSAHQMVTLSSAMDLSFERLQQLRTGSETLFVVAANAPVQREALLEALQHSAPAADAVEVGVFGEFELHDQATLISSINRNANWPLAFIAFGAEVAIPSLPQCRNAAELMALLTVQAVASGAAIQQREVVPTTEADSPMLSFETCSMLLQCAVDSCNIEELFPFHPWDRFERESAAACYHTIAAMFVRFGNTDAALDAIALSDEFEDSPRSLALKGMIAKLRGETLGAVANMVSSLQQYELRKTPSAEHYLSFRPEPSKLEAINSTLRAGLSALNKRDNETALSHFTEAVTSFDPFFLEFGIVDGQNTERH